MMDFKATYRHETKNLKYEFGDCSSGGRLAIRVPCPQWVRAEEESLSGWERGILLFTYDLPERHTTILKN